MNTLSLLGNIIWFLFGGFVMGLSWWVAGVVAYITIIGIPWGKACFIIGNFSFFPFGREIVNRQVVTGQKDIGTGGFGVLGNIIWFLLAGWYLAIGHLVSAILCMITVIGIPFGIQHIKLASISIFPIGKTIVSSKS